MPSQAAIEIASIFDDVIKKNLKYCYVCLRTEEERKLVEPEHFMKCLQIMKVQSPMVATICYVCESESTRAYALFQAINFASIMNQWFKEMSSKPKFKNKITDTLDRHIARQRRFAGKWPQPEWWRRVRARSDLVQTEVLVVDAKSEESDAKSERPKSPRRPVQPPCRPDNVPSMDSIVIIEDDEDPLEVRPAPPPKPPIPPPTLTSAPTRIPVNPILPYNTMLPVNTILNTNQNNNTTFSIVTNDNLFVTPNQNISYVLQPMAVTTDGCFHKIVPSKPKITLLNNKIQLVEQDKCKVLEVSPLKWTQKSPSRKKDAAPQVIDDRKTKTESNKSLRKEIVKGVESTKQILPAVSAPFFFQVPGTDVVGGRHSQEEVTEERPQRIVDLEDRPKGGPEKRAVMNGSRIDWEDKIPMDVISFVDASDPSIQSPPHSSCPKRHKSDVIDLC